MFRGSKVVVAETTVKEGGQGPILSWRTLFVDPDSGIVHAYTNHQGVPLDDVPGAKEAAKALVEAIERWTTKVHFSDAGINVSSDSIATPPVQGILETLVTPPKRFEQG